jgi:septal ring factor EnvC (AmiA/AmiB activator)
VKTMTKAEEKLQKLELKRKELEARIQREKARLSSAARKADTRRKVLVGAAIIAANTAGDHRVPDELLAQLLAAYSTDPKTRIFLGLDAPASDDSGDTPAPLPAEGGGQEMRPVAAEDTI